MPLPLATATGAQVVKKETAFLHQEVEQILIRCLNEIKSLEDYAAILQCFYSYYLPIEQAIQQHVSSSILPDIEKRRTALLIADDLAFLGMPIDETTGAASPQIKSMAQAFGVLYVLEGSTLGGKMIVEDGQRSQKCFNKLPA
jgi:heme oxygenase (biliverdin-IX-beta and delta-forming)